MESTNRYLKSRRNLLISSSFSDNSTFNDAIISFYFIRFVFSDYFCSWDGFMSVISPFVVSSFEILEVWRNDI